jgi:hypothetical protein
MQELAKSLDGVVLRGYNVMLEPSPPSSDGWPKDDNSYEDLPYDWAAAEVNSEELKDHCR